MNKVIIVGPTGSGKSTLATKLSEKLSIEYIQLDKLFWKPNWEWSTDEEFFPKIEKAIQGKKTWIIDGNYSRSNHLTWPQADTVIWIDFPFSLTLYQNLSRAIKRAITREELWPNTGNKESLMRLFSKDSIIKWLYKTYPLMRERYEKRFLAPENTHITFHRLRSRSEVKKFLKNL